MSRRPRAAESAIAARRDRTRKVYGAIVEIEGPDMTWISRLLVLALPLAFAACAASSTPRIRVARDLGCTADQTAVARIDQHRWQVTGCGRTAVYACTYPVRDCWREGEIHPVGSAPASRLAP